MRIESAVWYRLSQQDKEHLLRSHNKVLVVYEGFSQEVTLGGSEKYLPKIAVDDRKKVS